MTRAQAAVTLCRLADVIEAKLDGTLPGPDYNPNPEPEPEPEPEPDPGDQPTAKVPTEAEAYDILMQIKKEYPTGTPWGDDKTWEDKNNWVKLLDGTIYYIKNSGCAAFTTMCKERIFGNYAENGLTERDHTDFDAIKVGDEVTEDNIGYHVVIVVEKKLTLLWSLKATLMMKFAGAEKSPAPNWRITISKFTPYIPNKQPIHTQKTTEHLPGGLLHGD